MRLQRVRHESATKHSTAPRPVKFEEETFLATVELLVCTLLSQDIFNNNHLCFHFFSAYFGHAAQLVKSSSSDQRSKIQAEVHTGLPGNSLLFHFFKKEDILRHNRRMQSFQAILSL